MENRNVCFKFFYLKFKYLRKINICFKIFLDIFGYLLKYRLIEEFNL